MINEIKRNKGTIKHPGKYPVKWLINSFIFNSSGDLGNLGICGYSGNVAFIESNHNATLLLKVTDVIIKNGDCSHSDHCLNLKCEYNKTTADSFVEYLIISDEKLSEKDRKKVITGFDNVVKLIGRGNKIIKRDYTHLMNFNKYSILNCEKPLIKTVSR